VDDEEEGREGGAGSGGAAAGGGGGCIGLPAGGMLTSRHLGVMVT
jgi:hypothetical protein